MTRRTHNRCSRPGMTLVELLMVVTIMTILMAVAIPMVRPAFQNRQLREAARQLNAFFAGAKSRAAELGRPMGVWIEASGVPGSPQYSSRIYMAEVASDYTGAVLGSRMTIEFPAPTAPPAPRPNPPWTDDFDNEPLGQLHFWDATGRVLDDLQNSTLLGTLVSPTEKFYVRFDHKGPLYPCLNNGGVFLIALPYGVPPGLEQPGSMPIPPGSPPVGQTFEIIRGPTKSVVSPLTFPGDAVIDLTVSGVGVGLDGNSFIAATPDAPIVIMFTSNGQVGQVYVNQIAYSPTGSLFLLIGRRAKVVDPTSIVEFPDPALSNLSDPSNLWLTINNRTGAVTTEDNAATYALPASTAPLDRIKAAREFARASSQKGGR